MILFHACTHNWTFANELWHSTSLHACWVNKLPCSHIILWIFQLVQHEILIKKEPSPVAFHAQEHRPTCASKCSLVNYDDLSINNWVCIVVMSLIKMENQGMTWGWKLIFMHWKNSIFMCKSQSRKSRVH